MENMPTSNLKMMIYSSLFTALTIVGAYISIPTGVVPIVLSTFFIYLGGLLLGKKWALISTSLYLLLGFLGLPVFSGGNGGFHHIYGPTGGYLIGFVLAAFVIGLISENRNKIYVDFIALIAGSFIIHLLGILWLKFQFPSGWEKAFVIYWVFIIGDLIKIIVAVSLAKIIRPLIFPTIKKTE